MSNELERVVELLSGASRVVALTGAGMSAESGVPTFRDALTGLWSQYRAEELATPEAFRRNPARVFGWYLTRLEAVDRAEPHAGYYALAKLDHLYDAGLVVITQNVDGLHRRAGSRSVIELHGSLHAFRCFDRAHPVAIDRIRDLLDGDLREVPPPECGECGSPVRPGVVWFGEMLPERALERAWREVDAVDILLVVGTSGLVYPAAAIPERAATRGAKVVEINPQPTPISAWADVFWQANAGSSLSALAERIVGWEAEA